MDQNKTEIELPLNINLVTFGLLNKNSRNYVRNLIMLQTKFYIYKTKMSGQQLNELALRNYLKENLDFERHLFYKNKPLQIADTCWNPWLPILI